MDLLVINENKIKLVTSVEGVFFTTLHIPPNACVLQFQRKMEYHKYKQMMEFKTGKRKQDHK